MDQVEDQQVKRHRQKIYNLCISDRRRKFHLFRLIQLRPSSLKSFLRYFVNMSTRIEPPTPEDLEYLEGFYDFNVRGYLPATGRPSNIPCIETPFPASDLNEAADASMNDGYDSDTSSPDTEGTFSHYIPPPVPIKPEVPIPQKPLPPHTTAELLEVHYYPRWPLHLPSLPDYLRKSPASLDLEDAINRAKVDVAFYPLKGYLRLHQYLCLKEIKEEEEKLRASMEKICQLELLARKYEAIKVLHGDDFRPVGFEERMKELSERKKDYEWLLYKM